MFRHPMCIYELTMMMHVGSYIMSIKLDYFYNDSHIVLARYLQVNCVGVVRDLLFQYQMDNIYTSVYMSAIYIPSHPWLYYKQ